MEYSEKLSRLQHILEPGIDKDDFDTYRWNLCPSCKVGNLLLFSDSAPIDKFYFTPIDMLCYW